MAKFTAARFQKEGLPNGTQKMVDALVQQGSDLEGVLNNGLKFADNFACELKELFFTAQTPSFTTGGGTGFPLIIGHRLKSVSGIITLGCRLVDRTPPALSGAPYPEWLPGEGSTVNIMAVWGLNPGKQYKMTILLVSG